MHTGAQPLWGNLGALASSLWQGLAPPARKRYLPWWTMAYALLSLYLFAYMSGAPLALPFAATSLREDAATAHAFAQLLSIRVCRFVMPSAGA